MKDVWVDVLQSYFITVIDSFKTVSKACSLYSEVLLSVPLSGSCTIFVQNTCKSILYFLEKYGINDHDNDHVSEH